MIPNSVSAVQIAKIYYMAIAEATLTTPLHGIPNGHLYAMVQSKVSHDTHTGIISALLRSGMIVERNHLLTATKGEALDLVRTGLVKQGIQCEA